MSRLAHALPLAPLAAALMFAAPAVAAPGQVVFEDHVNRDPLSSVEDFPCLGVEGREDDLAQLTGLETRHIVVRAAGVDDTGDPIPPLTVHATFRRWLEIDPLAAGMPTYLGSSHSVFNERVRGDGTVINAGALFRATTLDGSGRLTFRFHEHLVVGPDGTVRVERTVAGCDAS